MTDIRLKRLADVIVNYSTTVGAGQWVGLFGEPEVLPALREICAAVVQAGGQPTLFLNDSYMARVMLREGTDAQIQWINPAQRLFFDEGDVLISISGTSNTRAMTGVDPKRQQLAQAARMSLTQTYMRRSADGSLKWVLSQFPTDADAQEANMSLEEYAEFVYGAAFCDREDPVAEWRRLSEMQQKKVDWLKGKKQVVCRGPNVDLRLSIEERVFINADGSRNLPDGEIFTGPVEESVNGWVRFTYPAIVGGRAVSGIELKFESGKVVQASAKQNEDALMAQLDTDAGSRYLGEFAIGTNFGINRFTGNILFDEKIGGTIHMAIGNGYPETGSKNKSAIHWDMICDMRQDSEIHVDGELFYKDGQFVV